MQAEPFGQGHIHDTYLARLRLPDGVDSRCILQQVNTAIFRDPEGLMENIAQVTGHLRAKILAEGGDPRRETLSLFPAVDGKVFWRSPRGDFWRAVAFIDRTYTETVASGPASLYQAARAYGRFQRRLADFPAGRLHVTLPNFHNTPLRFEAFLAALQRDAHNRATNARPEIDLALQRAGEAGFLHERFVRGELPERVAHNDTKVDNVLFDEKSGEGVCVIDLDTVMPGLGILDFGDLVRSGATHAAEDEPDLSKITLDLERFSAIAQGFLEETRSSLTPTELAALPWAARVITFEQGLRFLTDFLNGDTYYKTRHPGHNLERCRTQFKLLRDMEAAFEEMERVVDFSSHN